MIRLRHDNAKAYNIFRWYRAGWGRYTQADVIGLHGGANLFVYVDDVDDNPVNFVDSFGLSGSKPGGPYHPPEGVHTKCQRGDTCEMIKGKMWVLKRMIKSHSGWDWRMGPPRGGGRHAHEIAQLWTQFAYCQALYEEKCVKKCEKRPWWKPSPETVRDLNEALERVHEWLEPPSVPLIGLPEGLPIRVPIAVP